MSLKEQTKTQTTSGEASIGTGTVPGDMMSQGEPLSTEATNMIVSLQKRLDYLRRETDKVYEAIQYVRSDEARKHMRIHETITKARHGEMVNGL